MAAATRALSEHVDALRSEEASEAAWFILPPEGDDDVNWRDFQVQVLGPEKYVLSPDGSAERPSPYSGGLFRLRVVIPDEYPRGPPVVTFATRVWHPNVEAESGKMCADFITGAWKPTSTIRDLLVMVRDLMASPNASDAVNSEAASEIKAGLEAFEKRAREDTARFAAE